ncbi:broad specificity phosphatase PhoE [Desulfobotulus alkaliphilus]|uniref:Broad specificity phosphatase PhoE n=1 Tax=Desulfobotulus alkaliphilus TaxID=622671 RepID=A0A562S9Q4_9BACT|nr:histidine phosphatase family protein [Desulfobotulus alkaliphilus]TWI77280.1 broad specificity phosphatase PhoE [Desulfobotulus alkaliphilus]
MGMLYLIRHGQASFGEASYDKLSPTGAIQAALLADYLKKTGSVFDEIISGNLSRQKKTAQILMQEMPDKIRTRRLIQTPAFDEYDSEGVFREILPVMLSENEEATSDFQNMIQDKRAFQRILRGLLDRWMNMEEGQYPLESWHDFRERVRRGILDLDLQGKKKILVVTSGGVIATCMHLFLKVPPKKAMDLSWQCMNASISIWISGEKDFRLHAWNHAPHLEICGRPEWITYR